MIIKYIQEPSTERLLLEQGDIDVGLFLPDDVVEAMDGKPGIAVTNVPSLNLYYIVLPCKKGPTADPKVRQAIAYGFNYDAFVNDMLRGKAKQVRLSADSRKTALAAARVLGLRVAGVDMIESAEGPMVMEVNSSPGLEGVEKATGVDVAGAIIEHMERELTPAPRPALP